MPRTARGAAAPLKRALVTAGHVHGDDGLGNLDRFVEADGRARYPAVPHNLETCDGADLILEMADRFGKDLVVVALGPLTNLAKAAERDPKRLRKVARVVVMGGAVAVPGNVTPGAEFNFYVDPEGAAAVFEAGLPLELVPLDVTRQVVLRQKELAARLHRCHSRVARFMADFTLHGFAFGAQRRRQRYRAPRSTRHRGRARPSLVGFEPLHVEVECEGRITRGMSIADRRPLLASEAPSQLPGRRLGGRAAVPPALPGSPVPRVCVIGSANLDFTMALPRLPRAGETVAGGTARRQSGRQGREPGGGGPAARRRGAHDRLRGAG